MHHIKNGTAPFFANFSCRILFNLHMLNNIDNIWLNMSCECFSWFINRHLQTCSIILARSRESSVEECDAIPLKHLSINAKFEPFNLSSSRNTETNGENAIISLISGPAKLNAFIIPSNFSSISVL